MRVSDASATEGDAVEFTVSLSAASVADGVGRRTRPMWDRRHGDAVRRISRTGCRGTLIIGPNGYVGDGGPCEDNGRHGDEEDEIFTLTTVEPDERDK